MEKIAFILGKGASLTLFGENFVEKKKKETIAQQITHEAKKETEAVILANVTTTDRPRVILPIGNS